MAALSHQVPTLFGCQFESLGGTSGCYVCWYTSSSLPYSFLSSFPLPSLSYCCDAHDLTQAWRPFPITFRCYNPVLYSLHVSISLVCHLPSPLYTSLFTPFYFCRRDESNSPVPLTNGSGINYSSWMEHIRLGPPTLSACCSCVSSSPPLLLSSSLPLFLSSSPLPSSSPPLLLSSSPPPSPLPSSPLLLSPPLLSSSPSSSSTYPIKSFFASPLWLYSKCKHILVIFNSSPCQDFFVFCVKTIKVLEFYYILISYIHLFKLKIYK